MRVTNAVATRKRRKKLLKLAKGYYQRRKNVFRLAKPTVMRALRFATRDRKVRKREFRRLWILRLNAFLREKGISYSKFINELKKNNILLDRKVLADLAVNEPQALEAILKEVNLV